jgi:PRTRC genetic system protein C
MALQVTKLKRTFKFKKNGKEIELTDPNSEMRPDEVMKFYATEHPELTNGIVDGPKVIGDSSVYTLTTKAGTLG